MSGPSLELELDPATLSVMPGKGAGCDLRIRNAGSQSSDLHVELLGPAGEWSLATPDRLTLPAGGGGTVRLIVHPPRSPDLAPGLVPFTVQVSTAGAPETPARADGVVEVGSYIELETRFAPRSAEGRHTTQYRVEVDNRGNQAAVVTAKAAPGSDALTVKVDPATAELPPGATVTLVATARSRRAHVGRRRRHHHFTVAVQAEGNDATRFDATMAQSPVRWVLPVALVALLAGLSGLVLALGGNGTGPGTASVEAAATEAPAIPAPVYAVGARTETFVDEGRTTRSHANLAAEPSRTLRTMILYPATGAPGAGAVEGATPASGDGPFPLIVFAHGSGGLGERYLPLLEAWAGAGYVVAAPTFPFARDPDQTSSDDYANQPADMSFVATALLGMNEDAGSGLEGLIDPDRMGAAGHSLGGMTTLGLVANTCCHDPRFDAGVVLAGRQVPFPEGEFFVRIDTPLLLAHGDADTSVRYADGRLAYLDAPPPKFLVTLLGGDHGEPFTGSPDVPHARVVTVATLDFWDQQLRGAPEDLGRLRDHSDVAGVSRFDGEH